MELRVTILVAYLLG